MSEFVRPFVEVIREHTAAEWFEDILGMVCVALICGAIVLAGLAVVPVR